MASPHRFLENVRIVLVDDNADFRLFAAWFLSHYGAQVFVAKNAFEGLRRVREIRPDLVLCDTNMPRRNGVELLADIRRLGADDGGRVPVIALTGHVLYQAVADADFQGILRTPFQPDQLLAAIDSVLSEKEG